MKNFINLRIQSARPHSIKHNFRTHTSKVSRNQRYNAKSPNKIILAQKNSQYKIEEITDTNVKAILKKQRAILKADTIEYKKLYKKRTGRNPHESFNAHAEGVLTFSEAIDLDLGSKYTIEELSKIALLTINETCKKIGTSMVEDSLVFHGDEVRYHFHYSMLNFDKDGFSIIHKNKSAKILSSLQDIAFKHFGKLGMDRGIKRYGTFEPTIRHQTTSRYYEKQLSKIAYEHNQLKLEFAKVYEKFEDQKLLNKEKVTEYKILRDKITELTKEHTISIAKNKELHAEISKQQKELRESNKIIIEQQKTINECSKQIDTKKETLEIVKDLAEIDIDAKTFQRKLSKQLQNKAKSYAKVSQGSKVLNTIIDLLSLDEKKLQDIKYTFTAIELKKYIQVITKHATREAFQPHGNLQNQLRGKISLLKETLETKSTYIEPSIYQALEYKLSEIEAINQVLKDEQDSLFRAHTSLTKKVQTEEDKNKELAKIIANNEKDKLSTVQDHQSLKVQITLLQKQKKKLFEKARSDIQTLEQNNHNEDIK